MAATKLKPGWIRAGVTERCNYHWRSAATHLYCGTPLCERCVRAMGGAEDGTADAGEPSRAA
jgi:hypothetical protein